MTYRFDEFFDSGLEESISPFLKPSSRRWGRNLPLKASLTAAIFLALSPFSPIFLLFVYFLAGVPKLIDAVSDILSLQINIDVLMTLAAFLAVLIGSGMEGGLLLVLFAVSASIEESVTTKARSAVRALHQLAPSKASIIKYGQVTERHIRDVLVGETILIKAGEIVPLDGEVIDGASSVNLVHLTGEALPATKKIGDTVPAGARNLDGTLTVKVSHTSSDSTLSRIIALITQAQEAKPKFQRWLDKVSRGYALTIIGLALFFSLVLPFPFLGEEGSIYRSLAFLIAASPCALIIAMPVAYLSAVSSCARRGILLKGGVTLDALAACKAIAFDKTGTLTTGELQVLGVDPLTEGVDLDKALSAARALETHAVHPIASAILAYTEHLPSAPITHFRAVPGYGLEGQLDGTRVYIGHPSYVEAEIPSKAGELIALLVYGEHKILFRFQDALRPNIRATLDTLRPLRLLMLTGDHHANAETIAAQVGIDEFYADLRPEDKLEHVSRLANEMGLAMVGDGINDGPALARATAGISMGRVGSRTAIDASDVVLLQDNLPLLSWLWRKSHATQRIVRQNIALAFIAIIFASLSALAGIIPLWLAVLLHEGGTVLVGLNSLRLLR